MSTVLVDRAAIVEAARSYVGTPFMHQGRLRGCGIDCAGLLMCVAYDLRMRDVRIDGYSRQPDERAFREALRDHLDAIPYCDLAPGDILTFAFHAEQHVAIVTKADPVWIVHAYEKVGRCVEHPLDMVWMRRVRGCYRFREAAPWLGD